jgi:actin-like ATPase involved in cell morphogenesis
VASARLAIDLGTSHTVGVVHREGQQVRPLIFDGSPLLPSGVALADDGTLVTGRDAERIAQLWPDRYEPHPKRRVDEGSVLLGDRVLPISELLAVVLRRVVGEAGPAAANTVLTCPADWGRPRREVLRDAARRAGLGDVTLVDEPVAAAAYCMAVAGQRLYVGQALVVFDFGGGTLDVTVVRRDADQLRVLATGGLDDLGGLDVDAAVVGHLGHLVELRDPALWRRLQSPADPAQGRDRRAFWTEARAAKEMLSRTSSAPVQVPGRPDALHLTRDELERIAGPLIARAVDETRRVVERAALGTGALAGVLLVGGSSRIPLVASRLHARLGVPPTMPEQPELPVAHGALLVGGTAPSPPGAPQQQRIAPQPVSGGWGTSDTVSGSPLFGSPVGGPVSAAPYAGGPVSGADPPVSPAGVPTRPPGPTPPMPGQPGPPMPGQPGPPVPGQPGPPGGPAWPSPAQPIGTPLPWAPQKGASRRGRGRRAGLVATGAVVLSVALVVAGAAWVGRKVVDELNDAAGRSNSTGILDGGEDGGEDGGADGELSRVHDVAVTAGSAGAVAADRNAAYYAVTGADTTKVTALPAGGGKPKWTATVPFGSGQMRLTVVGGLVVLDGEQSTMDGDARSVLDAANGKVLWTRNWDDRYDLTYVGTEAIVEDREQPTSVFRIDLRTGKQRWKVPGPDDLLVIDDRLATAARTWPAAGAAAKATDPVSPPSGRGFRESLRAGTDVVILDEDTGRGKVVDGRNGKVRRSGALPLDFEVWTVYEGLVVGKLADGNAAVVAAYRLSDLKSPWRYELPAGSSIEAVQPCGPRLVCVVADPSSGDTVVHGVEMVRGTGAWKLPAPDLIDVGWYIVDGRLVFGEENWGSIGEASLLDTNGKVLVGNGDRSASVLCSDGGRAATQGVRVAGAEVVWQVAVGQLGSGKSTAGVDVGAEPPAAVALAGDNLVVLTGGGGARVRVYKVTLD